ncbi:DUF4153 domain-containing protein [Sphingomonas sp. AOB5]|uniref:DUF4153 domain-containing protein n=1 Tax=Sphingomonas sp. AOB5 TaxID=3034017 RepID=UPI0023FA3DBB|nr:DUF4153 domain-containing protein [Sphingomonas sp. AOB5]MDF7774367.1 DUF4153 domain-containing protein [Sphingomonas sp. AOB5]
MSDSHEFEADESLPTEHEHWPLRPALLALLGLAAGLTVYFLLGDEPYYRHTPTALTLALAATVTVTAGLIGFTSERRLWWASLAFSAVMGVMAGAVVWWNGGPDQWSGGDGWRTFSLFLGIIIAAPLFQAARDAVAFEGRPRFPYASVHDHAWTNVVLWGACWAFVGVTALLSVLLAQLFHLIKIDILRDLLEKSWFWHALIGTAFGGALGMLREQDKVVHLLQRVVAMVLAVLAPVLAIGLILFVLALPFTGLGALWEATSATTPLLLSCCVGSLILANAVIGNAPDQERRFPALKYGAMGLGLVMLPMAVIAAIATGLRIGQYGFTPDRLWALTFVVIACAYGLAYLVSLLRGRLDWAEKARPANLNLAFGLCAIALLLATPLISFNAISTRDQVARLESGKIAPDKFDWRALAFEFGQAGRDALERLKTSPNAAIKAKAIEVAKVENRWDIQEPDRSHVQREQMTKNLRVLPDGTAIPDALRDVLVQDEPCYGWKCTLMIQPDGKEALLLTDSCFEQPRPSNGRANEKIAVGNYCGLAARYMLIGGKWSTGERGSITAAELKAKANGYAQGQIEVRPVQRRQVFVGGQPVGDAFE